MSNGIWEMCDKAWRAISSRPAIAVPLTAIGGAWVASKLYGIATFSYFYFLHGSYLGRYKASDGSSWALVTGSSDGIGKGFAQELCSRGFNVILHGRNEEKLNRVKDDLLKEWPSRQVRVVVLDAGAPFDESKLKAALLPQVENINLKLLINNVANATSPMLLPFLNHTSEDVRHLLDVNARFHTEITRLLLPYLVSSSPAAVATVGSFASELSSPYLTTYAGAKAYLNGWSNAMNVEMQAEGHDIQFYFIQTGMVSSNISPRPVTVTVPSSRNYAKHSLDKIGGGRRYTPGHWAHALQFGMMLSLPTWMQEKSIISMMKKMEEEGANKPKAQ